MLEGFKLGIVIQVEDWALCSSKGKWHFIDNYTIIGSCVWISLLGKYSLLILMRKKKTL